MLDIDTALVIANKIALEKPLEADLVELLESIQ
jgi:hypothetical protein